MYKRIRARECHTLASRGEAEEPSWWGEEDHIARTSWKKQGLFIWSVGVGAWRRGGVRGAAQEGGAPLSLGEGRVREVRGCVSTLAEELVHGTEGEYLP